MIKIWSRFVGSSTFDIIFNPPKKLIDQLQLSRGGVLNITWSALWCHQWTPFLWTLTFKAAQYSIFDFIFPEANDHNHSKRWTAFSKYTWFTIFYEDLTLHSEGDMMKTNLPNACSRKRQIRHLTCIWHIE